MKNKENDTMMTNEELILALQQTKDNVKRQASMAVVAIAITVVLCFAITVAWYSNILHTSDLTFKADTWDFLFEGKVTLNSEDAILAAPGDYGIIDLEISNVSDTANVLGQKTDVTTIGVQVNVDKSKMSLMGPRIYFYVEATEYDEDVIKEYIDRQYLSSQDSYRYTIYPGKTLTLSDEYSNNYPIKWHWVDEVVGYYVRGTLVNGDIENPEYIRPIEYDSGKATYDEDGNLLTVNGVLKDEFILENYLSKDGIKGTDFVQDSKNKNYYKVSDDLYIYLCNKTEIDAQNKMDLDLSTLEDTSAYAARIILTGIKADGKTQTIMSSADLATYINEDYDILKLESSLTIDESIVIEKDSDVMIDLNGYTLSLGEKIQATEGSSVGFMNGTITPTKVNNKYKTLVTFIEAKNSELFFDNVVLEGFESAIEIYDKDSVEDSHIYITQCKMTTNNSVVWLRGNGEQSSRKTSLVIEESELTSETYIPVGGNGTQEIYGTDIQILTSTLRGKYAGIYHPMSKSTLYVKDSTIIGDTGIAIKGGSVVIENSTVNGIGEMKDPAYSKSGFTSTGDAVYIEDNYAVDNKQTIDLVIKGEKTALVATDSRCKAIQVYKGEGKTVSVAVYGGIYSTNVATYLPKDGTKVCIEDQADGRFHVLDTPATDQNTNTDTTTE